MLHYLGLSPVPQILPLCICSNHTLSVGCQPNVSLVWRGGGEGRGDLIDDFYRIFGILAFWEFLPTQFLELKQLYFITWNPNYSSTHWYLSHLRFVASVRKDRLDSSRSFLRPDFRWRNTKVKASWAECWSRWAVWVWDLGQWSGATSKWV